MKQKILTYIDYGMGGIFIWVSAESPQQVSMRYPRLQILDGPPTWMDHKQVQKLESKPVYDIDSDELAKLAK
jgi:hypothetical protein